MFLNQKKKTYDNPNVIVKNKSKWSEIWQRLCRSKTSMIALAFIVILVLACAFAGVIAPYDYETQNLANKLQMPSAEHIMGTDAFGRDIFSRLLYGGRISLLVALLAVGLDAVMALILGSIAGYFGGKVDDIMMRILDVFMAIPGLLLAIAVASALGDGIVNTAIAVGVAGIAPFTRQVRSTVMLLRNEEYIEAARLFGASDFEIIVKHIIPNTLAPLIVQISTRLANTITSISGLSFIGLGVHPPIPEWGQILSDGRQYIRVFTPLTTYPGLLICLTTLAFSLLGDGLRDAMDPRLKR